MVEIGTITKIVNAVAKIGIGLTVIKTCINITKNVAIQYEQKDECTLVVKSKESLVREIISEVIKCIIYISVIIITLKIMCKILAILSGVCLV